MTYSVVIPTQNAGIRLKELLQSLQRQSIPPNEILVIDTASNDDTVSIAKASDVHIVQIEANAFDHGGTRNLAVCNTTGDFIVFFTQDALPMDEHCLSHLLKPMEDTQVAACCGRQLARADARAYEKLVRQYRYPPQAYRWTREQIPQMGIRSYMISNVCAAYRRSAWESVGGFDQPVLTNEDMLMAQKLLEAGWTLCYCGDAVVIHSHKFNFREEFCRNQRIGRVLERFSKRFGMVSDVDEGLALVRYVFRSLVIQHDYAECVFFAINCAARLAGNRIGRLQERWQRRHEAGAKKKL